MVSITPGSNTITVDKPFAITPDSTSGFTLVAPLRYMTVYQNTIKNCAKGIWPFGNAYDDVVADNTSEVSPLLDKTQNAA